MEGDSPQGMPCEVGERFLVLDASVGQQAGPQAQAFHDAVNITGVIITKLDGTAKGGGALSAVSITKAPVTFIGVGEHIEDLEKFEPPRFISRMLGMGDLQTLLEKAQESMDKDNMDDVARKMISGKDTTRMIELIMALPHGVYRMSPDIKELVETSTNLSKVRTEGEFYAQLASRSSSKTQLEALRDHIEAIATLAGADAVRNEAYPGWLPNLNSKTLAVLKECALEVWGKEAHIKAIHAGLETGIIGEKFPGMDMASIGPQIENPHSPDERVKVDTVEGFYKMVSLALKKLC